MNFSGTNYLELWSFDKELGYLDRQSIDSYDFG